MSVYAYSKSVICGAARRPCNDEVASITVLTLVKVNSAIVFRQTLIEAREAGENQETTLTFLLKQKGIKVMNIAISRKDDKYFKRGKRYEILRMYDNMLDLNVVGIDKPVTVPLDDDDFLVAFNVRGDDALVIGAK